MPGAKLSYLGVDPMGPVDFMTGSEHKEDLYIFPSGYSDFVFSATSGDAHASVTVRRALASAGLTVNDETVTSAGFYGSLWEQRGTSHHAAVVAIVTGKGSLPLGAALASSGYPVLELDYFGEPGLPKLPENFPLSYFAGALRWLAPQPSVDPKRIFVLGASYESQLALLVGAYYPGLVHGVIALNPSSYAYSGITSFKGAPWTFDGRAVPSYPQESAAAAQIPVARIRGPLLMVCGGADNLMPQSCAQGRAIMHELAVAGAPYDRQLLDYPQAGHWFSGVVPYMPGMAYYTEMYYPLYAGQDEQSNATALANEWPRVLAFLAK